MLQFNTLLSSCRLALCDRHRAGGDVDLASGHYHLAYMTLSNVYKYWKDAHTPFDQYVERCALSILRRLGGTLNIFMSDGIHGGCYCTTQDELEQAVRNGYTFRPVQLWEIKHSGQDFVIEETSQVIVTASGTIMPVTTWYGSPWSVQVTENQSRLIMRHIWRRIYPAGTLQPYIEALPYVPLNKKTIARLVRLNPPRFVKELFYAFYNENRKAQWWPLLRDLRRHFANPGSTDIYAHFVARCYEDAIGFGDAFKPEWKTRDVMALIDMIRLKEDFSGMPILADALQEAGCEAEQLLHHLRSPMAEHTLGSWIFRATGRLT